MIKKIRLKKTNSLLDEYIDIEFSKGVNVIIGPRGGGKSTLFDLLASITKGYISDSTKEALNSFGLAFHEAIYDTNETLLASNISIRKSKEKEEDFIQRNDVIFQDDPIKKNINSSTFIEKQKFEFAKEIVNNSVEVSELINKTRELYQNISKIPSLNTQSEIVWSNTFKMHSNATKTNLITNLNYNPRDYLNKLKEECDYLDEIKVDIQSSIKNYSRYSTTLIKNDIIDVNSKNLTTKFKEDFISKTNSIIEKQKELLNLVQSRIDLLKRIEKAVNLFNNIYKKKIDKIKASDFSGQGLKIYEKQAHDYFKYLASYVNSLKKSFNYFLGQEVTLDFSKNPKKLEQNFLGYELNKKIKIETDYLVSFLKNILYVPKKSINDIKEWIITNQAKDVKEFNENKLINSLSRDLITNQIDVIADGMNYNHMSLGQRSIYGIKYKFNKSINENLFLDQPEDNLDNHTIASNILDLIASKKNNQVFIVTHNANIGILSNPEKVIVANMGSDLENPYIDATKMILNIKENPSAYYLEGGSKYLEERYNKFKNEK